MTHVMACIDGSASSVSVCDHAAWASLRLEAPLTLLHVLDHAEYPVKTNLSGNIGLGTREHLRDDLAELDEKRSKLALEQGREMLRAAKARLLSDGVGDAETLQRHGSLVETLHELEETIRLLVIGKTGEGHHPRTMIGSHIESVIRTMHRPILVAPPAFETPRSVMIAYDGSPTALKGIEKLAASPLLRGLPLHMVMVVRGSKYNPADLDDAARRMNEAGFDVQTAVLNGEIEPALHGYQREHEINLLVMGAYGHSRIREFLVGSTTNHMLATTTTPLLLLR